MKLKHLLKAIPSCYSWKIKGSAEIEITGLSSHSKLVSPGNLFIHAANVSCHKAPFIAEAVAAGATAVLTDVYNPFLQGVAQVLFPTPAILIPYLGAYFYQRPDAHLLLTGVTGTNGKTTTSYLIRHILNSLHKPCGLMGTITCMIGDHVFPSLLTTADLLTNYKYLHDMRKKGCAAAVMEVSSHALIQQRVCSLEFDVAVLTNISEEHLDYHKTMLDYVRAKSMLFSSLSSPWEGGSKRGKKAVVNQDSCWKEEVIKECNVPIVSYGIEKQAELMASEIELTSSGICCRVTFRGKQAKLVCPLMGLHNVYNCLAALGVVVAHQEEQLSAAIESLAFVPSIPGRLERVANALGIRVFIDFAHTEQALRRVLLTLNQVRGSARIITVFGCGGQRDPFKRPKMGAVAEALSDEVIVTNDNPRQEDPAQIIHEILQGCEVPSKCEVIYDRKEAITHAIHKAKPTDIVLIAGRGHEEFQIFGTQKVPCNDARIAEHVCRILELQEV